MKNLFPLLAGTLLLLSACSKEPSGGTAPVPAQGDGTGKFNFNMDTADYRVDTLLVSYRGRDGQTKTETILGRNSWSSADLVFKTGDSIHADVQAFGTALKSFPPAPAGLTFEVYPSVVAVPPVKTTGGTNTTPITGNRFQHRSSRYYTY